MPVFNKMVYNWTEYILWWWGNIWEPLNLTVTTSWLDATITWTDNEIWTIPPTTFQKSELVRKIGSAPTSPSDWVLVVTETVKDTYKTTWYVDQWLTDWETYYYRVFSYSDLWGISYCDAESVTISRGRQPWANTIAYYTFNGDCDDSSSNWYDLTPYNVTYSTITNGDEVAYFNGSNAYAILTWLNMTISDATMNIWIKKTRNTASENFGQLASTTEWWRSITTRTTWTWDIWNQLYYSAWQFLGSNGTWIANDTWMNVVITAGSTGNKLYVNGQEVAMTYNHWNSSTPLWTRLFDWIVISRHVAADANWAQWYVSKRIIEDKMRTASEISDYYDLTKWSYWL